VAAPQRIGGSPSALPPPTGHVLVIDDSVTILKVVGTILEKNGYTVSTARDGREALKQLDDRGPFDLCLLDFVMPRMNGYQFCRELRSSEKHKQLPVVLMSARTNAIGERFVEQTGAVDALGKPFDARALIAVVGSVLKKKAEQVSPVSMPTADQMDDEESLVISPDSKGPPSRHFRSLKKVATQIAEAVAPHVRRLRPKDIQGRQLHEAIALGINTEVILKLIVSLEDLDLSDKTEVWRGDLAKLPLAEVLQLLQLRRQTGIVTVRSKRKTMTLYITEGALDYSRASGLESDSFLLGRYFVEKGWLERDAVDLLVKKVPKGKLLGEWLRDEEHVTEDQLTYALEHQSAELLYEALRWTEGRFTLRDVSFPPEAKRASLGLGLSALVLEGFRRVDEWRLMADTVDFEAILVIDQVALGTVDDSKISEGERPILMAIDGERTVREVLESTELAQFDAIKTIYGFLQSRIIREMSTVKKSADELGSQPPPENTEVDKGLADSHDASVDGS
jgi:DNA-binding response OmpR family regulator